MKALSLIQPWANLIPMGDKRIETRSWATKYRGPLLIHASMKMPKSVKALCRGFAKLLGIKEYNGSWLYYLENGVGEFGKIIGKCSLVDCQRIIYDDGVMAQLANGQLVTGNEYAFGDYAVGRYAWILADVEALQEPIPAKGQLGLWEYGGTL